VGALIVQALACVRGASARGRSGTTQTAPSEKPSATMPVAWLKRAVPVMSLDARRWAAAARRS
jgi:hypothetical protein